jgi:hypothetical protein
VNSAEYASRFGDWRVPGSNVVFCEPSAALTARPRGTAGSVASFDRADRNRDGRVTVSEWDDTRAGVPHGRLPIVTTCCHGRSTDAALGISGAVGTSGRVMSKFDQLDRNRNNRLERNEWRESAETFNWLDPKRRRMAEPRRSRRPTQSVWNSELGASG